MSSVMDFVNEKFTYGILPSVLSAMHSCEGFDCESIVEDRQLKPTLCKVFNENLLYLFYGKPSYPIGEKKENRTDDLYCPVCFLVDVNKINIKKVFPFDSGAYMGGMYDGFIHRHMKIDCFEIQNTCQAIGAYISVFFGNNDNYISGLARQYQSDESHINALLNMLNAVGSLKIDERANTIEIITNSPIDITNSVQGIILPRSLMRKEKIVKWIEQYKIPYKTYTVRHLTSPLRYNEKVFELAMEFMEENK